MLIEIDTDRGELVCDRGAPSERAYPLYERDALGILSGLWLKCGWNCKYSYDFEWMGRPIIQMPDDIVRLQELVWRTRPDVVVETGVAHGGSAVFFASMMALLDLAPTAAATASVRRRRVIAVEIDLRAHNREALDAHPLSPRITIVERSSTDPAALEEVRAGLTGDERTMVFLDSGHSKSHVARELELYATLVSPGCYLVVADGVMSVLGDVPRGEPGWAEDNPMEAAREFLRRHPEFEIDPTYTRTGVTYLQGGYLRRT